MARVHSDSTVQESLAQTPLSNHFNHSESVSQTYTRVCSTELLCALSGAPDSEATLVESSQDNDFTRSKSLDLQTDDSSILSLCRRPASGRISPALLTLEGARRHKSGKWRSDDRLLPKQTRTIPSLLPPAPLGPGLPRSSDGSEQAPVVVQRNLAYSKAVRRPFPQARAQAPDDDITVHGVDESLQEGGETKNPNSRSVKNVFAASFVGLNLNLDRTGTW